MRPLVLVLLTCFASACTSTSNTADSRVSDGSVRDSRIEPHNDAPTDDAQLPDGAAESNAMDGSVGDATNNQTDGGSLDSSTSIENGAAALWMGSSATLTVHCCNAENDLLLSNPSTQTVTTGTEFVSLFSLDRRASPTLLEGSIDLDADGVVLRYAQDGILRTGIFNGYVLSFSFSNPAVRISRIEIDPNSALGRGQFTATFDDAHIRINGGAGGNVFEGETLRIRVQLEQTRQ